MTYRSDKIRSAVALAARQQGGAGKHGGSVRQRNRRERKATRQALRETTRSRDG